MELDSGNTAWVLMSTALVLFMTPGLALFYGGMVRGRNVLGMLMQNIFAMGLMAVLWVALVFSLAFGDAGNAGVIGNFDYVWLRDVGPGLTDQDFLSFLTIPFILFCGFQMTFAIITPALITGATADRLKFPAYVVFIGLWLVLVYGPLAHMVFAGGWLADMGALDFAGGAVVHMNAGAAALAVVLLLGSRKGYPDTPMPPHNLPMTVLSRPTPLQQRAFDLLGIAIALVLASRLRLTPPASARPCRIVVALRMTYSPADRTCPDTNTVSARGTKIVSPPRSAAFCDRSSRTDARISSLPASDTPPTSAWFSRSARRFAASSLAPFSDSA